MNFAVFRDCSGWRLGAPEASARVLVAWGPAAMPGRVGAAMWLRRRAVAPFGLKTRPAHGRPGDLMQRLPVLSEADRELVSGIKDRYLDFHVRRKKTAAEGFELAPHVSPHNRFGRICLALVLRAHRVIMRRIARGLAQPIRGDR